MRSCDNCGKSLASKSSYRVNSECYNSCGQFISSNGINIELCDECYANIFTYNLSPSSEVFKKYCRRLLDKKIKPQSNKATLIYGNPTAVGVTVGKSSPDPNSIEITCDSLVLKDKSLAVKLDLTGGIENFEKIIINGEVFINQRLESSNSINTWRIIGYRGFSDNYSGPEDDNLDITIKLDKTIAKDEVIAMLNEKFKQYRFRVFKLYLLEDTDS